MKPGVSSLDLKKGEKAVLWSGAKVPKLILAPATAVKDQYNRAGLK